MKKYIPILIILLICFCKDLKKSSNKEKPAIAAVKKDTLPLAKIHKSSLHKNLSKRFNYQSFIQRIPTDYQDSCVIKIEVYEKNNPKIFYTVNLISTYLLEDSTFVNKNVRSYITGKNVHQRIVDNQYGDIVIADFNFDNLEDFAIKREEGGNGGPIYNFYLAQKNTFILDEYLSDTMATFPNKINKKEKILQTLGRASAVSTCKISYKYNPIKGTWKEIKRQYYGE